MYVYNGELSGTSVVTTDGSFANAKSSSCKSFSNKSWCFFTIPKRSMEDRHEKYECLTMAYV